MSGPDLPVAAAWLRGGVLLPNARWEALAGDPGRADWWRWQPGMSAVAPAPLSALVAAQASAPSRATYARGDGERVLEVALEPAGADGALALAHDVSLLAAELHRSALDLLRERQQRAADGFHLERVLHDLCNYFHAIELRVSFLRAQPRASTEDAKLLQDIEASGASARRRIEAVQREALRGGTVAGTARLDEVVARAAALTRRDGGVATVAAAVAELPPVVGLADELAIALINLLDNAREAGGAARIDGRAAGAEVTLTISDDGPGIPAEVLLRLGKPFYTTKGEAHRGHGLAHAAQLVRHGNGRLEPGNRDDGRGARVTLTLARAARNGG